MALDLPAIVRVLESVESRHPDAAAELAPVIQALSDAETATIGTEQARKLLGVRSVNTVKRWIELGILSGHWDQRSGRWRIPLADVLDLRQQQAAISAIGGEDLTAEELATLSATQPGRWPWQHIAPSE